VAKDELRGSCQVVWERRHNPKRVENQKVMETVEADVPKSISPKHRKSSAKKINKKTKPFKNTLE
jgi:hypothetical protein